MSPLRDTSLSDLEGGPSQGGKGKTTTSNSAQKKILQADVDRFEKALKEFKVPEESSLVSAASSPIRRHPDAVIEEYFEFVTHVGVPCIAWHIIKPAFVWKIKFVMDEMMRMERTASADTQPVGEQPLERGDVGAAFDETYQWILDKANEFEGAPFTWQRICELLTTPTRHYKKAEKFVRALDKTINVVTTVTEQGIRVTGGVDWMPQDDGQKDPRIEQRFFGRVDEVDGDGDLWDSDFKATTPMEVAEKEANDANNLASEPIDMRKAATSQEVSPAEQPSPERVPTVVKNGDENME